MFIITKGDDTQIPCELEKKGSPFLISGTGVAKAVLTALDRTTVLSAEVTVNMSAVGTNLAASTIIVEFTEAQTAAILQVGEAYLEVQLADPKKLTWTKEVLVRQGNIS